jgi:hypothetical protein
MKTRMMRYVSGLSGTNPRPSEIDRATPAEGRRDDVRGAADRELEGEELVPVGRLRVLRHVRHGDDLDGLVAGPVERGEEEDRQGIRRRDHPGDREDARAGAERHDQASPDPVRQRRGREGARAEATDRPSRSDPGVVEAERGG